MSYSLNLLGHSLIRIDNTGKVISVDLDAEFPPGPAGQMVKYCASKIVAHQATRNFVKERKPDYTLITLHPTYVMGHDITRETAQGVGGINALLCKSLASEKPLLGTSWVHVQDVADAHVKALHVNVEHGKEFLLSSPSFPWEDAIEYIRENFPGLEVKLVPPFRGKWKVDVTGAETVCYSWNEMGNVTNCFMFRSSVLYGGPKN